VDSLPCRHIQFLALLIGPTYPLRSVQTPNQVKAYEVMVDIWKYMYCALLTAILDLKNIGLLTTCQHDSQPQQKLCWQFGNENKLDIFCSWEIFRLKILLPFIDFNRVKGLFIHHTFEN
jgi:hypothetical protein